MLCITQLGCSDLWLMVFFRSILISYYILSCSDLILMQVRAHNDKRCLLNKLEEASGTTYSCQQPAVNVFSLGVFVKEQWTSCSGETSQL